VEVFGDREVNEMDMQTRKRLAAGLLAAAVGIAFLFAASRIVPRLMRGMMQAMMKEMASGKCGGDLPEM
jgi:hypothetical protein